MNVNVPARRGELPDMPVFARKLPSQKRSKDRFERILDVSVDILREAGPDAFRMSDVVERSGVAFGSLYQYFPDKTAIFGTLACRYNEVGHACVRDGLAEVREEEELHPALCEIVDGYYRLFQDEPVMQDLWQATQADRALQHLDTEDVKVLAGFLADCLIRLDPGRRPDELTDAARLLFVLMAAAVRYAITLPDTEAQRNLDLFKRMLPRRVADI
ncbi:MAG: TetR/AcrR family transcriptional regulator [Alphaproteobacteria bacterium]|nr:TetR/AcrR family transcriptional regulator [Alphaproteobacteria bacterium]